MPDLLGAAFLAFSGQSPAYEELFRQGVASLEADRLDEARRHFSAAGELAPEAPVWKAYLARAGGVAEERAQRRQVQSGDPWKLVEPWSADPRYDPTGERFIEGRDPATLRDVRTGETIAVLSHRGPQRGGDWKFDATGRLVIGLGRGRHPARPIGLDVRDARTGDPVEVEGADDLEVTLATRFEWVPRDSPEPDVGLGRTLDLNLGEEHGALRCWIVEVRTNEELVLSPNRGRAIFLHRQIPMTLRLVAVESGEALATVQPASATVFFSQTGATAACVGQEEVLVLDAESGRQLDPVPLSPADDGGWPAFAFVGDLLSIVRADGIVTYHDLRTGMQQRIARLRPEPASGLVDVAFTHDGKTLLVNGEETIQAYDVRTSGELWSMRGPRSGLASDVAAALSPDGRHLVSGWGAGAPRVVDVRTGKQRGGAWSALLQTRGAEILPDSRTGVVAASDGSLRLFDLETGATLALAWQHAGSRWLRIHLLDAERLLSEDDRGLWVVRDASSLEPESSLRLEGGAAVLAVSPQGKLVAAELGKGRLGVLSIGRELRLVEDASVPARILSAAFSPDGAELAVLRDSAVQILDASGCTESGRFGLVETPGADRLAYYGPELLLVGWGSEPPDGEAVGIDVLRRSTGERVVRLVPAGWFGFGGWVGDLRGDPDLGRIVYSISSAAFVAAFDARTWKEVWSLDYWGGDGSLLQLERAGGSRRLLVSGMTRDHACVVDLVSGEEIARQAVSGCYDLRGSADDRYLVGCRDDRLVVFDCRSLEEQYVRSEGERGTAWILRGGFLRSAPGATGIDASNGPHLARNGTSRPADCWDAWLLDPLGILPIPLEALPEPPRIVSGPPRVVLADRDRVRFEVKASDESPLIGLRVEIGDRPATLFPIGRSEDGRWSSTVTVEGPWPVDAKIRALSATGVSSASWRVHVRATD